MKKVSIVVLVLLLVVVGRITFAAEQKGAAPSAEKKAAAPAAEQKGIVDIVKEGCKTEIETYCKFVTPGEGRMLACMYAHEDKLSDRCGYALYDAASQLEKAVNTLKYAATQCKDDLQKFCAQVKPGQGRMLECIDKNSANVSDKCKTALKDTGLKK